MEDFIKVLKQNPVFYGLEEAGIASVLKNTGAVRIRKKAGEYLLRAGDPTQNMGFVLSGSVLVVQDDLWGHRNIMCRITAGDVFAEPFAAAPGAVLNVSVMADEEVEAVLLNVGRLLAEQLTDSGVHNRVIRNLVSVLARKTMAFNDKITHISKRTTREKLLSFLSAEAIRKGSRSFEIPYNRQQLADYLCVERAAMSVELSRLQKDGILEYHKNHFELKEFQERPDRL